MRSGRPAAAAPGRKDRRNADGSLRVYWVASQEAVAAGYEPKTVRIHEADELAINARCGRLQAEMLEWLAERAGVASAKKRDDVNALVRAYRTRSESPFHEVKWNTRRTYDSVLGMMEKGFGEVPLASIRLADLKRWYEVTRYPEGRGRDKPDHVRTAHGLLSMLRRVVRFGAAVELAHCARIAAIFDNTDFQAPAKRAVALTIEHVTSFIATARKSARPSLALGTALQWELMLRQRDVIGEWAPFDVAEGPSSAYVVNGRQWVNGLTWSDISPDWVLTKATTKTGAVVSFDLTLCPMAQAELQAIPDGRRFGPVVIDEGPGRPYAESRYQQEWRKVAIAAGLPATVCNMDARAGGATEATDAGANLSDIRPVMGHSDPKTTTRYVRGDALAPARRVATLRVAHRAKDRP